MYAGNGCGGGGKTYTLWVDLNPSDKLTGLPVEKTDAALALDTKKHTTAETLGLEADIEHSLFLEVAEKFDAH